MYIKNTTTTKRRYEHKGQLYLFEPGKKEKVKKEIGEKLVTLPQFKEVKKKEEEDEEGGEEE